ncbi:hypothetical protein F4802DRAFT_605810 [Xylaria palmicola]|nr:hypothetical protein F4802DRAFT_605810 [Xylaria palmicola]
MSSPSSVFNHLVLPPDIPGAQDIDIDAVANNVLGRLIHATHTATNLAADVPWQEACQNLHASLQACQVLNRGHLERSSLLEHMKNLEYGKMLILYLNEQNAGLLIRRDRTADGERAIFESFEASATSSDVLAAGHAMQWDFPGRSAYIKLDDYREDDFQECLVAFLEQASMESLHMLQASTRKAGVSVNEIRDTTNPALISHMLMSLLEAVGGHYQAPVLRKRVRDDVNLTNTNLPWRRLPFWLILRVAAQRHLCLALGAEQGQVVYKVLMAILLAKLLDESARALTPSMLAPSAHQVVCLRTKLARRMAKLERNEERTKLRKDAACEAWFVAASVKVRRSLELANGLVGTAWDCYKRQTTRQVPHLPYRAPPESLVLTLPNSGRYLDEILSGTPGQSSILGPATLPNPLDQSIRRKQQLTEWAFSLAALEERIEQDAANKPPDTHRSHQERCLSLASRIQNVFDAVGSAYKSKVTDIPNDIGSIFKFGREQNSAMILAIFTLWVELDKSAIEACPLLADHRPVFPPQLLDPLQLPSMLAMERLQQIQEYLAHRYERSTLASILKAEGQDSIAVRYVASSHHLRSLEARIQRNCQAASQRKRAEHADLCNKYDERTRGIESNPCACTFERESGERKRIVKGCTRCWHWRMRKNMKIMVKEDFLPSTIPARHAVVFDLDIPNWLSAYRDATWHILSQLTHPYRPSSSQKPAIHLRDSASLQPYMETNVNRLSLASKVKGFENTHYKFSDGRAPIASVILPFAARFRLYDLVSNIWVEDLTKPLTLEHLCEQLHPPTVEDGPSSYQIQANQAEVPKEIQTQRRWPNLLVEMSSSNLNISDEDTMRIICQLASQAGPRLPGEPLRAVHETLENMLESIQTNWREHNIMQLVITLSLGTPLLTAARKYLLEWISELRKKQYANYGLFAALLCRETFAIHIGSESSLSQEDLSAWIQASLGVQENTLHDLGKLSETLRGLLFRDAKMVYRLHDYVKGAMIAYRPIVGIGILSSWPTSIATLQNACCSWTFMPAPDDRWIVATTPGKYPERIHFNYIEGHLLVNGKPRSKLPLDIADDKAVRSIFGDQHLLVFPTRQPGMSHRLVRPVEDSEVYFGLRDGQAIIRSCRFNRKLKVQETWEFVPKWRLSNPGTFDLPVELIQNCGHWLNINTGRLEIRRGLPTTPAFWVTRPRDWIVDVRMRKASRGEGGSLLVDPQSETFTKIAKAFCDFEQPHKLTVFQPRRLSGKLTVELKHFDLVFVVWPSRLLYCQQLHAEIDPDQDAGTWYGLRSKIVMREVNTQNRSIIVPLGDPVYRRNGLHVDVRIQNASHYAKFKIDTILGRLSCSPEPRILYTKALYHAITSFCLPDSLTGQTGSSEAFAILQSGAAQPWASVTLGGNLVFDVFSKLIPRREYYPPNMERIQKLEWDSNLTPSIQCDGYGPLIELIKERSNNIAVFTAGPGHQLREISHLCYRGGDQRQIYDPFVHAEATNQKIREIIYAPRDRRSSVEATHVYQISRVILSRCSQFCMDKTLASIFESTNIIGGFSPSDATQPITHAASLVNQIEDPVNENWGELVQFCQHRSSKTSLLFRLGLLAFNKKANMDIIHSLAAFGLVQELKSFDPPQHQHFLNFRSREAPSVNMLENLMRPSYPKFERVRKKKHNSSLFDANNRTADEHDEACKREGIELAKRLRQHWPIPAVEESYNGRGQVLIDVNAAWENSKMEWQRIYANAELSSYLAQVDKALISLRSVYDRDTPVAWRSTEPEFSVLLRAPSHKSIVHHWAAKRGPNIHAADCGLLSATEESPEDTEYMRLTPITPPELAELDRLRKQYVGDLRRSLTVLAEKAQQQEPESMTLTRDISLLNEALSSAEAVMNRLWIGIATALAFNDSLTPWLELGAMRPLSTATELLKLLRSTNSITFGVGMKEAIVLYGIAITEVQRFVRIRCALLRSNEQVFQYEMCHLGHVNWKPIECPEWLLLEVDSDMLIRNEQVTVAKAIIDPKLGNGVLQLSMGKGKTSCIIPMVEAVLADGKNLSRVIVPKALIMQTAQTLQSRLGGLVGRNIIHVPFSRRTSTEQGTLDLYADLHRQSRQCHGIMLTCAEHVLSYKLFGWQKFVDAKTSTAHRMIEFQKWLDTHCRDVLDECDFTLSVKTQLNYPSGPELPVDFHPYRWQIAQELLGLVASHLRELQRQYPKGIQVTSRQGNHFPAVQFLGTEAEDGLHSLLIDDISSGRMALLRPGHPKFQQMRSSIREVLCRPNISDELLVRVTHLFSNPSMAANALLLVRGLLLHRIIITCLGKRWNVQYGLHQDRDPIAVPYEAKGKPSEQAEFGHPDVAILSTCLSFYYSGLNQKQLMSGVQNILLSNDPAAQYEWWTSTCSELPVSLRNWNVINADDKEQMEQLWYLLRLNRTVIDHYLNHFVFPLHARQFEIKLQACAWDIPICSQGDAQSARTTGFSGTNDNRMMLPLTIRQRDLPELQHTSAEVLSYLLQPRNREFHVIANWRGERLTEKNFLEDLKKNGVSVLIDAGAYISEMDNQELARAWLQVDPDAKAVIYFQNDNRAWVHYRNNTKEDVPLLATPLAEDLSDCRVFLDEGHTRGVDLRLPINARGAVTLALKLTKDHTVQAAMRLRQLQTTQSLCFYGPPEVDRSIRNFHHLGPGERIDSSHVIAWLLEQTCRSVEDLQGLYVAQGIDFCRRTDAVWRCKNFMKRDTERNSLLEVLKQPERKTIKELYGPTSDIASLTIRNYLTSRKLGTFMDQLILAELDQHGKAQTGALEEVEQERQVEAHVENVRQVEKRKKCPAMNFPGLHEDIKWFTQTGILRDSQMKNTSKPGFEHAFAFVGRTAVAKPFDVHATSSKLFVSAEFSNIVQTPRNSQEGDNYLRPVEWIVWSRSTETALVIIPEEAEEIMKDLRKLKDKSPVHLIAYAAPVTRAMLHFNRLDFYSSPELPKGQVIPERIRIELGILAGRLYVDQSEWKAAAEYVRGSETGGVAEGDKIAADPAAFLLEWLTIRRKTVDVLRTPMGCICMGREMEIADSSEEVEEA